MVSEFGVDAFSAMFDEQDRVDASRAAGFLLDMMQAFEVFSEFALGWVEENRRGADSQAVNEFILQFGLAGIRFFGARDRLADFVEDYVSRDEAGE